MLSELLYLIPIFFLIALLYSSAGFGGGSSYLAILSLSPMAFEDVRMTALICNIAVVTGSLIVFHRSDLLQFKRIIPLVLLSVPLAFIGGGLRISETFFFVLLGITLLIAGLMMLRSTSEQTTKLPSYTNGIIGGAIGFLSGVVGIGGGIFLSPVLYLTKWGKAKIIAATTALFILVNSIAGLTGQVITHGFDLDWKLLLSLVATVIVGGQIGARMTAHKLHPKTVKRIAALLIIVVAIRQLYKYMPEVLG